MKKQLLTIAALGISSMASAQILDIDGMPPYKLGVMAGVNFPTFSGSEYSFTIGTQGGIDLMVDASEIIDDTYFRGQLKYSMKGATLEGVFDEYFTTHYIEIPIHYGYSYSLDSDWSILADTGPYLAVGLAGTHRIQDTSISDTFFHHYHASRIDYGWGFQLGLLFDQQFLLNLSCDFGFKNMNTVFLQNNCLSVGLTYFIE